MCLIAFAWRVHPRYPLILVANRDEFHERPSAPLAEWPDAPGVYGGRDLRAGGGWLALDRRGRLAAVTNVREPQTPAAGLRSRGALVSQYLLGTAGATAAAGTLHAEAARFGAFNLLLFDGLELSYSGNRPAPHWRPVPAGVHGLSNASLDSPWPKSLRLCAALERWLALGEGAGAHSLEPLFAALADRSPAEDGQLPDTGIGREAERVLAPPFIAGSRYGTRCSSLILIGAEGWRFEERRFGPDGLALGSTVLEWPAASSG